MNLVMVCRCLKQIDELINILTENQDTVTVGENISEESENVDVRFVDFFFLGGIYMIPAWLTFCYEMKKSYHVYIRHLYGSVSFNCKINKVTVMLSLHDTWINFCMGMKMPLQSNSNQDEITSGMIHSVMTVYAGIM